MSLAEEIVSLIKEEGLKINDVITDALAEFLGVVEDENEAMEGDDYDEDEIGPED